MSACAGAARSAGGGGRTPSRYGRVGVMPRRQAEVSCERRIEPVTRPGGHLLRIYGTAPDMKALHNIWRCQALRPDMNFESGKVVKFGGSAVNQLASVRTSASSPRAAAAKACMFAARSLDCRSALPRQSPPSPMSRRGAPAPYVRTVERMAPRLSASPSSPDPQCPGELSAQWRCTRPLLQGSTRSLQGSREERQIPVRRSRIQRPRSCRPAQSVSR
jgi:hypothetical protein